jgi:hypothetical protein
MEESSGEVLLFSSLTEAETSLKEQCVSLSFVATRNKSKKSKKGVVRKVWYACAHGGEYKNKPITVYSQLGQFILYYMFQVHRFYNPQPMLMHFIVFKLMDLPNNTTFDDVVNAIDLMIFPDESEMEDKMPSIKYYNRIRELVLNE